jgi:hypothetical protein
VADGITLPGTGQVAATDDVTVNGVAGHVQYVKLVDGTSNGTDALPGTAANGLDVDVTRVIPGTTATALGKAEDAAHADGDTGVLLLGVRNYAGAGADGDYSAVAVAADGHLMTETHLDRLRIQTVSSGLTIATTAYTAGDQVGPMFTLANAARVSGGTGRIVGVTLMDESDIIGAYDVVFCRSNITLAADNAAFSISDADALNVIGLVPLAGAFDIGGNRIAQAFNLSVPYDCSGGTSLYASLITRVGHTFFSVGGVDSLALTVWVERD